MLCGKRLKTDVKYHRFSTKPTTFSNGQLTQVFLHHHLNTKLNSTDLYIEHYNFQWSSTLHFYADLYIIAVSWNTFL